MNLIHAGYLFDSAPSPVIKFMLNNGADVNLQNTKGDSPIAYAVIAGDVSLLRELLARGANPNTRDKRGMSPYGIALLQNGGRYTKEQRRDILALLKRCGAKP
jgi:ankyrin repeat protein